MELSQLGLKFDENTLAETNGFTLHITDEKDLSGLPEGAVEMAAMTAKEKELEGWLFTLHSFYEICRQPGIAGKNVPGLCFKGKPG